MIKYHAIVLFGLFSVMMLSGCGSRPAEAVPASLAEIREQMDASSAPLTLVHVWATWCPPCRAEFPELVKVQEQFADNGVKLILISADEPADAASVAEFLAENQCPVDSLITTELDGKFIEMLSPNWGGALPASFFYVEGELRTEWEGMRSFEQYAEAINKLTGGG